MAGIFPSVNKISYDDLSCGLGVNDPDMAIRWCQEHGLISDVKEWDMCGEVMSLVKWSGKHGRSWQCKQPCQRRISIRKGTFFENLHLSITVIIKFNFYWAIEILSIKLVKPEFRCLKQHLLTGSNLRDICTQHLIDNPIQLSGPGRMVKIDESVFTRRKYNCGRMVAGIDTTTRQAFLVPVEQCNADTRGPSQNTLIKIMIL